MNLVSKSCDASYPSTNITFNPALPVRLFFVQWSRTNSSNLWLLFSSQSKKYNFTLLKLHWTFFSKIAALRTRNRKVMLCAFANNVDPNTSETFYKLNGRLQKYKRNIFLENTIKMNMYKQYYACLPPIFNISLTSTIFSLGLLCAFPRNVSTSSIFVQPSQSTISTPKVGEG